MRNTSYNRSFIAFLGWILLMMILLGWYLFSVLRDSAAESARLLLRNQAAMTGQLAAGYPFSMDRAALDSLFKKAAGSLETRLTFISLTGQVIADSRFNPASLGNYMDRPEVHLALQGQTTGGRRHSLNEGKNVYYLALPVFRQGEIEGALRLTIPTADISAMQKDSRMQIVAGLIALFMMIAVTGFLILRHLTRPLQDIEKAIEHFARGDLNYRVAGITSETESGLADGLNRMAAQMNERVHLITDQRNELESVLNNMVEGVLVLDRSEKIVRLNREAESILGIHTRQVSGLNLLEILRNNEIEHFIRRIRGGESPVRTEVVYIIDEQEKYLSARGSMLHDADGRQTGILLVFQDVSHLVRLENMRREFVANVSHELKTPITSIRGFVETLLDGAIEEPESARQFLDIIHRHVQRLNSIINNLLTLSRVEQEMEGGKLPVETTNLRTLLDNALAPYRDSAVEKNIDLELHCPDDLSLKVNHTLLEEAVSNLVDNALKFSEAGKQVSVSVTSAENSIVISVADTGPGIPAAHLPRLFERFYRVDPARDRRTGGSGLGLAIVKHIVRAHGGEVRVESEPGKGSTFFIELPRYSK